MDQTIISDLSFEGEEPESRVHTLVVVDGDALGVRIQLGDEPVTIGRDPASTLTLGDREVSKAHCEVHYDLGVVLVRDLGSTNGTFVDGERVTSSELAPESRLRVGRNVLRYEFRDAEELSRQDELAGDLARAREYVEALLPAPLSEGPLLTEWTYVPSATLGGDGFGYHPLDGGKLAVYLLDVCGHGVGAALHAVAVLNAIRNQTLPEVDFAAPSQVLERLNEKFGIDEHAGLFFTLWYGVFDPATRVLEYSSGGHPPSLLLTQAGLARLHCRNPPIGSFEGCPFEAARVQVAPGDRLFAMSDGAYEIVDTLGERWGFDAIEPVVLEHGRCEDASRRVHAAIMEAAGTPSLEDDFSFLVATFV